MIEKLEADIEELKGEVEDLNSSLKDTEKELAEKRKGYDKLLTEKEDIEADVQKTMDCPKCGDSVELPLDTGKTLHLNCESCGAKGRLPNPNTDVMLDLEDINEEIQEVKEPVDELEVKISEITDQTTDKDQEIKNKENEITMKNEEKVEYIEERMKETPDAPERREKKPPAREPPSRRKPPVEEPEDEYDEEEDEEVEQEDEDAFCPMCYADLVDPPYNKCPGCGWEEEADHSDTPSTYDEYSYDEPYEEPLEEPVDDFGRRFEEADYYDPGDRKRAAEEHYQVPCRCGATIDIWTSKRPTKIHCESCGARGMLKGMGKKVTDDYHGEFKYDAPGTFEEPAPSSPPEKPVFCGSCGARNVGSKFCSECGDPLGDKKKERPEREGRGRKPRPPKDGAKKRRPERGRGGKGGERPERSRSRKGEERPERSRSRGRSREKRQPPKEDEGDMEGLEEQALNILVKLEKLLDKGANRNKYFPEIEDEMDGLEEEIEKASSPGELKAIIKRAKGLGNKVNREMKK